MENTPRVTLDDASSSKTHKSPIKTSTAAKENLKWDEDAFFKRLNLNQMGGSILASHEESPIPALKEVTNFTTGTFKNPILCFSDSSLLSDGANSSLGILHAENITDYSDGSFTDTDLLKKNSFPKLQRSSRVFSDRRNTKSSNLNAEFKTMKISENFRNLQNEVPEKESDGRGSSSQSSGNEFDCSNIPQLNFNFDALSLNNEKSKTYSVTNVSLSNSSKSDKSKTVKEDEHFDVSPSCSKYSDNSIFERSVDVHNERTESSRQSIFENFNPEYESLLQQLATKETILKHKSVKNLQKIKVCPFLGVESFEVEPKLRTFAACDTPNSTQNNSEPSSKDVSPIDVENIRHDQNESVDFCPELISARSSSFKSSLQHASNLSAESDGKIPQLSSCQSLGLPDEGLENEVLSGSCFQNSNLKLDLSKSVSKDSNFSEQGGKFDSFPNLAAEGENWCNVLGISESEFFNSETAKEILKKDKEAFEKENMFDGEDANEDNDWSLTNKHEVTPPPWFIEQYPNYSGHHVSIGTFIAARCEDTCKLPVDPKRDKKNSCAHSTTENKQSTMLSSTMKGSVPDVGYGKDSFRSSSLSNVRTSALSEILDDISFTDPLKVASAIIEKCVLPSKDTFQNSITNSKSFKVLSEGSKLNGSSKLSKLNSIVDKNSLNSNSLSESDTLVQSVSNSNSISEGEKESDNTLVQSVSNGSSMKQNEENKSTDHTMVVGENTFNISSAKSTTETVSARSSKSDPEYRTQSVNSDVPLEYSRPPSSCSSGSSNPVFIQNAQAQYGCMNCMQDNVHCIVEHSGNVICPHVCARHTSQNNGLCCGSANSFHHVVPSIMSNPSAPLFLPGPFVSRFGVQVPSELHVPEKLAVGDSQEISLTLQNTAPVSYYIVSFVSAYLNDTPVPNQMSGLSFNEKTHCSIDGSTDIKLIITPRFEGKLKVVLQIDAFLNLYSHSGNIVPGASTKTQIFYEIVYPSISFSSKGKERLHLDSVISNSTFVEYVTLTNNTEVPVSLRISLSNDSTQNEIYFGLKELERQIYPTSGRLKYISPKLLLCRIPGTKNKSHPSCFEIPVIFESIKEKVSSVITAAIDIPNLVEVLASFIISAHVGFAKLILEDTTQNPLILKTVAGSTCNQSVRIKNDGTLSVTYDFQIESENNYFSVSPNSFHFQPKESAVISVNFSPVTLGIFKGKLVAAAEPHGQLFPILEVIGEVGNIPFSLPKSNAFQGGSSNLSTSKVLKSSANKSEFPVIEVNKKHLAWGGVDIGNSLNKSFSIRNPRDDVLHIELIIKDKARVFEIIDDSNGKPSISLTLFPKDEKLVTICFTPKSVTGFSTILYVKILDEHKKGIYSVSLSGYGGMARVKVVGLPNAEGMGYTLNIDSNGEKDIIFKNITLYNFGLQAAFVKVLVTYDGLVAEPVPETQTSVKPSELVLLNNEKRDIQVSINIANRNYYPRNQVILLFFGDELLRKKVKREIQTPDAVTSAFGYIFDFNIPYDGEDKVTQDVASISPKDVSLFSSNVKKLTIHVVFNTQNISSNQLCYTPMSIIEGSFSSMTLNSTTSTRPSTVGCHSPPVKESARESKRLSVPRSENKQSIGSSDRKISNIVDEIENLNILSWLAYPEELILNKDNSSNRILLKSLSDLDMKFKLEWNADIICASPANGFLPANKDVCIKLTVVSNKKIEKYCEDVIKIICDGATKEIKIKLLKNVTDETIPSQYISRFSDTFYSIKSGTLEDTLVNENTMVEFSSQQTFESSSQIVDNIAHFPKLIKLKSTSIGILSETILNVHNPSQYSVRWNVKTGSILFIEPFDDSLDSSDSVIQFVKSAGLLKPLGKENITINFLPKCSGQFSQFFELLLHFENGNEQKITMKIIGHVTDPSFTINDSSCRNKTSVKKRVKTEVFIENELCQFPSTITGKKSTEYITIKNIGKQDTKLTITKPSAPFFTNHSSVTVRSKRFVRLPVSFTPVKPASNYESEINFKSENGLQIKALLKGSSC